MPAVYEHRDVDYFRPGHCQVCGTVTYHKPFVARRPSGRYETLWSCEGCGADCRVLDPVENEIELFAEFVRLTYFPDEE